MNSINQAPGVVSVKGKKYGVNLLWGYASPEDNVNARLKESMSLMNSKLYLKASVFSGDKFAVGDKELGHKRGLVALLSAVECDGSSMCAILPSDEDFWLVFAFSKEGIVLVDKVFASQGEAQDYFNESVVYSGEWDKIYSHSSIGQGEIIELSDLITSKGIRLKETGVASFLPFLFVILVGGVLVGGGYFLTQRLGFLQEDEIPSENFTIEEPVEKISAPWSDMPKPLSFMVKCLDAIELNRINSASVPGWFPSGKVSCVNSELSYQVEQQGGLLLWMRNADYFFSSEHKPKVNKVSENSFELLWPLDVSKYDSEVFDSSSLRESEEIKNYLVDTFENNFIPLTIEAEEDSGHGFLESSFSFTVGANPLLIMPILNKVEHIVITKIERDAENNEWIINGKFWGG